MEAAKKRSNPVSSKQKEILINFIEARPEMYTGKLTQTYTSAKMKCLWGELANILNSVPGGPAKEWQQWRKTWVDYKKNCKAKLVAERKYSGGTGGGPPMTSSTVESTMEDKMWAIISPVSITGNQEIEESDATFVFDTDISMVNSPSSEHVPVDNKLLPKPEVGGQLKETNKPIKLVLDHNYSVNTGSAETAENSIHIAKPIDKTMTPKRKIISKTQRLSESIKNNRMFLQITKDRTISDQEYKKKKLELMERQCEAKENYYKEKLRLLRIIAENSTKGISDYTSTNF